MDWRVAERFYSEIPGRPSFGGNVKTLTYYEGQTGLPSEGLPRVLNSPGHPTLTWMCLHPAPKE